MNKKYAHLLSPVKIGNTVFRNRLFSAPQGIHTLQAGEPYPTQAVIEYFANKARGGAAMVTLHGVKSGNIQEEGEHLSYDIYSAGNRHYLAQLADAIHLYGARASMELDFEYPHPEYDASAGIIGRSGRPSREMPEDIMDKIAEFFANQSYLLQDAGYDMVLLHMAYRISPGARFLSPATNRRTDRYGGSVENRARFPIMIFDRIKEKCGRDFLIELRMSGSEPGPHGITIEDSIKLARILEGHIDLLQVHSGDIVSGHPLGFSGPAPNLANAEAIKKSGTSLPVVTIGGYQDLDECESIIASGKADLINMARGWIADPELGIKACDGRGGDVVPCIKCMRCHDSACIENRTYVCSVNPVIGMEHRLDKIIRPASRKKKIAVVGGGPAGMQAALTAAERGHDVALYEKSGVLGGQLNFADNVPFKRSLAKFKNYLISRVGKSGVRVILYTKAGSGLLEKEGYDVVIAALGADQAVPPIAGIDSGNVIFATSVYGNENSIGNKVAVIGGGQAGCETALHLALLGHEVTLLEMQDNLAPDASPFYRGVLLRQLAENKNMRFILKACCFALDKGRVAYTDSRGKEMLVEAVTVVIAAGMKSNFESAMSLCNASGCFMMAGDCEKVGNVEKAIRSAFSAAILL